MAAKTQSKPSDLSLQSIDLQDAGGGESDADGLDEFMPGEIMSAQVVNVHYRDHRLGSLWPGRLVLTNYRLVWVSSQMVQDGQSRERIMLDLPLTAIQKIDKPKTSQSRPLDSTLSIQGKDMQHLVFVFTSSSSVQAIFSDPPGGAPPTDGGGSSRGKPRSFVYNYLCTLPHTTNVKETFAYSFHKTQPTYGHCNGWDVYNPREEFKRLGVAVEGSGGGRVALAAKNADGYATVATNATWRLTNINNMHKFADTYPAVLCVPASADDELIRSAADFRSRRRLPVLSWLHPITGASITRCSQPLTGISNRRNVSDERYLKMILDTNPHSAKLMIVDARPQVNAIANRSKGGGYEIEENYQDIEFQFFDVDNIHVMRESQRKLRDICSPYAADESGGGAPNQPSSQTGGSTLQLSNWRGRIEETKWLEHIKSTIAGALRVLDFVNNQHYSVLVHCSDGWDRTAQIVSLAQLMLDPYYRTVNGFQVLVEKEWISMGHRFALRIGVGEEKLAERSPIFLQFIDAVWQLTQQFPRAFEFNERFLIFVLDHLYSGLFGTFLFNSEYELVSANARQQTHSIWTYVNAHIVQFLNPMYCLPSTCDDIIEPVTSLRFIKLWAAYYCRWDPNMNIAFLDGGAADVAAHHCELIAVNRWLERELQRLKDGTENRTAFKTHSNASMSSVTNSDEHSDDQPTPAAPPPRAAKVLAKQVTLNDEYDAGGVKRQPRVQSDSASAESATTRSAPPPRRVLSKPSIPTATNNNSGGGGTAQTDIQYQKL